MRYHTIGDSDIKVSEIGFGCWTMGGPNFSPDSGVPIGWGDVDVDEVLAGIKYGLDYGITHFDNADVYGNGRAERMFAECLSRLGVARDRVVIATKVGHLAGSAAHAFEPHHIRRQCEQSLRNLGTDYIDIYYLHHDNWADDNQPGNLPEAAGEMHRLKDEGKIRMIGQSAYSDDGFVRSVEVLKPKVFQSWASMLFDNFIRPGGRVQQLMDQHHIGFVAFSPLGQGLLLDKFDPDSPPQFDKGDFRLGRGEFGGESLLKLKPKLAAIKSRFGPTTENLSSAACRFVGGHPNVCSVIPGFRNERQAKCNIAGGEDVIFTTGDLKHCRELFEDMQLRG